MTLYYDPPPRCLGLRLALAGVPRQFMRYGVYGKLHAQAISAKPFNMRETAITLSI